MRRAPGPTWASVLCLLLAIVLAHAHVAAEPFPHYDIIRPNVTFWTQVYTQYTSRQAIIHDSHDLAIIYAVIDLQKPHNAPGARKINRQHLKRVKAKYRDILEQLAADPHTQNSQCRRVAKLFGPDAGKHDFRLAGRQIRSQIGQRDRFRTGLIRSGAYIDEIRTIFESYGLPPALAYLPHVESSFNLKAYSKFGAAGIWQFTRSTGRRFMTVNYVLDERRDPIKATHAAVQLLKKNYQKLKNWPLAITAYNHGAAGMLRAQRSHGDYPAVFMNYKSRTFKFASRNFYSEFLAAWQIAADYAAYFGDLRLSKPVAHHAVVLDGYAKFTDLCRHFKVFPESVAAINPALRSPVYNGQKYVPKGYALRLPADVELDGPELAAIPAALYQPRQKPSRFYTVQRGDTAGKIARRHGVELSDLILANNLNQRATIYPKQTLRIPLPGQGLPVKPGGPQQAALEDPQRGRSESAPATGSLPQPVMAGIIPAPAAPPEEPVAGKAEAVELPSAEIVAADMRFSKIVEHNGRPAGIIQVEVEETLGHYAQWAGVPTRQIRRLNDLAYGMTLHLHQKIKIPIHKVCAQEFETHRYEYHKRLQEDFFAVYRTTRLVPYRIKRGDNYWTLCREKFQVPMWLLQNSNPKVDFAALQINQKLWIPVVEKISPDASEVPIEYEGMYLSRRWTGSTTAILDTLRDR